jgi:hypothetical protein
MGIDRLVPHIAQAHGPGHVLQLAIAVGRTGQAIQRVVGDVKLHHPAPQLLQLAGLGVDLHAGGHRRGAGCGRAVPPFDFHKAKAAGAESVYTVRGAKFRD